MTYNVSPLAGWYFCACLKVPPKEAFVFLSILETLHNPESGAQLLSGAYKELAKLDAWQQVFILPAALDSLRREDLPSGFAQPFTSYLYELKEFLQDINLPSNSVDANNGEEVTNPLASLLDAFVEHSDRGIRDNLKRAISLVVSQPPPQVASSQLSIPYLALMEYLPQTLLITSLLHLLHDEQFGALVENEWKENTLLPDFLLDALNYRFGRQAFVLAIYFQLELARRKLLPLRELPGIEVMENASPCFVLEPDLVQAYSAYRSCLFSLESDAPSEALLDEYLSLYHFRQILLNQGWFPISEDPQHSANLSALVERVGGKKRKDWLLLAITYWQAAQINVLFSQDVSKFIQLLPEFWIPAGKVPDVVILRNLPALPSNSREVSLIYTIFQLLAVGRSDNGINIQSELPLSRKGHREKFASQFLDEKNPAWLFFSPWLSFRPDRETPYYIEPGSVANFLRLANAFFVAQRVLQLGFKATIPTETQRLLASLILHASDVLSLFSGHLDSLKFGNKGSSKLPLTLPLPTSSLALWMRRQTELIAQGFFPYLTVEIFGNLLDGPAHDSRGGMLFSRHILPKALLRWANMAYPLACAGSAALNWFEGEESVVRKIFNQKRNHWETAPYVSEIEILDLQLVFRFLLSHENEPIQHFARFDWRKGKFDAGKNKLVPSLPALCWAQQFLLTGPVEQVFWTSEHWEKAKVKDLRLVVRNIERWFSSTVYEVEYDLSIQWHEAFKNTLNTIGSPRDLNRFVRLRLVEILEVFVARPLAIELQDAMSITRLLLEFGSPYELHRLIEVLFPHEQGALKPTRREDGVEGLQSMVLDSLNQFLQISNWDSEHNQVRLPEQQAWFWFRTEVVELLFQRLAFSAWKSKEHSSTSSNKLHQKLTEFAKSKCRAERERINLNERVRTFELSYFRRNGQTFSRVDDLKTEQPFMIERAVVNPNSGQVKVRFAPIHKIAKSIVQHNLFEKSIHELKAFDEGGEITLEDVLAYCIKANKYEDHSVVRLFNCGLKFFLRQELQDRYEDEIKPGDWVLLTLRVIDRDWSVLSAKPVKFTAQTRVHEQVLPKLSARFLGKNDMPLKSAFPDIAAWYSFPESKKKELEKEKFWTLFNPRTGAREPYPFGFTELLLWSENFGGQAVLAFVREEPESSSLVFSTSPGVHFYLRPSHFFEPSEEDSGVLSLIAFLNSSKDLSGELLTVRPIFQHGRVLLNIVATVQRDEKLEKQYPNLGQFDRRNYDWAHIFDAEGGEKLGYDYFTAHRKQWRENGLLTSHWFIKLEEPVEGFPEEIEVGNDLHTTEVKTIVSIENWTSLNQLIGKVGVRMEEVERMSIPLPLLSDFCKLQLGSLLKAEDIIRILDKPRADAFGRVRCKTRFGILMQLETETLSLLPLKTDAPLDKEMLRNRQLVVSYCNMKEIRTLPTLIFDKNYLPISLQSVNRLEGFLTKTAGTNYFEVNWRLPDSDFHPAAGLSITNFEAFGILKSPIQPGLFLDARVIGGKVEARLLQKIIYLRATWKFKDIDGIPTDAFFVGADEERKDWYFEYENSYGCLLRLPRHPARQPKVPELLSKVGATEDTEVFASEWRIPSGLETTADQRVPVTQGMNVMMARRSDEPSPRRKKLAHVRLKPYLQADGSYDFKRFFEFALEAASVQQVAKHQPARPHPPLPNEQQPIPPIPAYQAEPKVNKQEKLAQEALDQYLTNPFPLKGQIIEKTKALDLTDTNLTMVPVSVLANGRIKWDKKVSLKKNEGVYLTSNRYLNAAEFMLLEEEVGNIFSLKASLRRHDYSPETFRQKFFPDKQIGDVFTLDYPLVVVGEEKRHPVLEDIVYTEPHFRFEWGYGLTMTLPSSQLTVDGQPVAGFKECVLAMMDLVKAIRFVEMGKNEDDSPQLGLDIRSFEIEYTSDSSKIYRQRRFFKFIHLLTLVKHKDSLVVATISGGSHLASKPSHDFHVDRATLRHPAPLLERLAKSKNKDDEQEQSLIVYGRLSETDFKDSFGAKVIFDHVWLSFADESPCGALPLEKSGEILFFKSGEVVPISGGNDYVLEISPLDGISPDDVGKDFKVSKLGVHKRQFSAREDTLSRVFKYRQREKSDTSDYFPVGSWIISRVESIGERLIFNMTTKMPHRLPNILGDLLRKGEDVLVTVLREEEQDISFTVELRPGIFIKLDRVNNKGNKCNVRRCPEILAQGDRLKVSLAEDKEGEMVFDLGFAAFSDFDYVGIKPRIAVVLPKNNLLRQEDVNKPRSLKQLAEKEFFTIGGLPNVEPSVFKMPGRNAEDDLKSIMACQHPKLVELWKEEDKYRQFFFILPVSKTTLVGKIEVKDGRPFFVSMDDREIVSLQWELLTFQACAAEELTLQLKSSTWEYHDKKTGFWHLSNGSPIMVESERTGKHNGQKGPLVFLENRFGVLNLRPYKEDWLNFGFPVDEIFAALRGARKIKPMTFIGMAAPNRIWMEISPGRLAELTPQLVEFNFGNGQFPLADFNWQNCAQGDAFYFTLASENPLEVERLYLQDFVSGNRAIIGSQRCLSPFSCEPSGAIKIGKGSFAITVPFYPVDEMHNAPFCSIDQQNNLRFSNERPLEKGQLLELIVQANGPVEISGRPGWVAEPDTFDDSWERFLRKNRLERLPLYRFEGKKRVPRTEVFREVVAEFNPLIVKVSHVGVKKVVVKPTNGEAPHFASPGKFPLIGDTVFIAENVRGKIHVLGFEYSEVFAEGSKIAWEGDSIKFLLTGIGNDGSVFLKKKPLSQVIKLCGGALPVTMEGYNPTKNGTHFYFSRRNQINPDFLQIGQKSIATYLGMLDGNFALLRCGTELFSMPLETIIVDIQQFKVWKDLGLQSQVFSILENYPKIWIRREPDGGILAGIGNDALGVGLQTELLGMVSINGNVEGCVMRTMKTQKMYWLPAGRMSWMYQLDEAIFKKTFTSPMLKACLLRDNRKAPLSLSLVDLKEVLHEYNSLKPGKELAVRMVERLPLQAGASACFIAQTLTNNILVLGIADPQRFREFDEAQKNSLSALGDDLFRVTVLRKIQGPPHCVEVAWGTPPPKFDLPIEQWKPRNGDKWTYPLSILKKYRSKSAAEIRLALAENNAYEIGISQQELEQTGDDLLREHLFLLFRAVEMSKPSSGLRETAVRVANYWLEKNIDTEALELSGALTSILILEKELSASDCVIPFDYQRDFQFLIVQALHEISLRSSRSAHVEALGNYLNNEDYGNDTFHLSANLDFRWEEVKRICLGQPVNPSNRGSDTPVDKFSFLQGFCNAARIYKDFDELVEIVSNAIGESKEFLPIKEASIVRRLAELQKKLPGYHSQQKDLKIPDFKRWWDQTDCFDELKKCLLELTKKDIVLPKHFW